MHAHTSNTRKVRASLPPLALIFLGLLLLMPPSTHTVVGYDSRAVSGWTETVERTLSPRLDPIGAQPELEPIDFEWLDFEPLDFEPLAGLLGHAEAWQRVYGRELETRNAGAQPSLPPLEEAIQPASNTLTGRLYLPLIVRHDVTFLVERRAIWISRYDWTRSGVAPAPESLDAMVAKIAAAGFNTIFFQIRAAGDAYYTPGLEPWASRLTGSLSQTLGKHPGWDPLARMIAMGQAAGLEVHAWVNVYPAWLPPPEGHGERWPPATTPPHMFDWFTYGPTHLEHPGYYGFGYDWRQHDAGGNWMPLTRNAYLWATPGEDAVNAYVAAVVRDIVNRYPVDGVHLDLVRYAGRNYSYDPASNAAAGSIKTAARDQWQRDRITALVRQVTVETAARRPGTMVSAAVWPIYLDHWNWGGNTGYHDYYQDSQGWLASEAVGAIVPMLYGSTADNADRWSILMHDFLLKSGGRPVYPGIGAHYTDFNEIAWRIETARAAGAQGHALFSYGGLNSQNYWDDLTTGPYRLPAVLP
jgi:uncharacterized lipoprotein YddW (UPF0748 family)